MAFVVENGAGLANATSYASEAETDTYFTDHGAPVSWTGATTSAKETALMLATQYIDNRFQQRWKGQKSGNVQALDWPRGWVSDYDGYAVDSASVPKQVKDAAAEAALRSIDDGALDPDVQADAGVISQRDKVGPLETETHFASGGIVDTAGDAVTTYRIIDRILSELLVDVDLVGRG